MADIAPSTYFDVVISIEPAVTDDETESESVTAISPSTEFKEVTLVESING